jgi:23S rRNA pseudouridine2605 synthase
MSEKLQKIIAKHGLGSRREIERWLEAGRVTVNGQLAKLGDRADESALIQIDGKTLDSSPTTAQPIVLLYHKPEGEVCTRHDPEGRPTVFDNLPAPPNGRWVMVGRLDYNTSGLLLFTNDGELANRLMHPKFHLSRVYNVRVYGTVMPEVLTKLRTNVMLEDGPAHFDKLELLNGTRRNQWYQVTISMGRNRIVRRLWESQDIKVNRLIRVGFGNIMLPSSLEVGQCNILSPAQTKKLNTFLPDQFD